MLESNEETTRVDRYNETFSTTSPGSYTSQVSNWINNRCTKQSCKLREKRGYNLEPRTTTQLANYTLSL